jgi:poly(ribitol-phosphate) beta-N-acetylglucosaminyltransferase
MTPAPNPRVSVIIPVHNTARYLEECLGSVFSQTLSQDLLEVIAVDDGSTDESLDTLRRMAEGRSNVRVLSEEASGTAARPRNIGIEASRGDYLFFLDSDDYLDREALAGLVRLADETGSGMVLPRQASFGSGEIRASSAVKRTRRAVDWVDSGAYRTAGPGKLFRASIVREGGIRFPTGFRIGEDMPFTFTVALRSPHVSMLGDKPYYYVRSRDDRSSLRQRGQSADEVLLKNVTVLRTIERECSDQEKRIVLMQRGVLGPGGIWRVFTHPRVDAWDDARRRAAFNEAHELLAAVWNPDYRRSGPIEAHVLTALIWAGDYDGTVQAAHEIADGTGLAVRRGVLSSSPRYISSTGTVVRDVVDESSLRKTPKGRSPA